MRRRVVLVALAMLAAALGYAIVRRRGALLARLLRLPAPRHAVASEYDLAVPMADGVMLSADRFFPREAGLYPTVLVRTPYGRPGERHLLGPLTDFFYTTIAAQGYHVVVQSVRGRFSSEGRFAPFVDEAADGRATLDWIAKQPWFNGALGLWGASYVGYTQWAVAADAPPFVRAMVPAITSSRFSRLFYPSEGVFTLESSLNWVHLMQATAGRRIDWPTLQQMTPARRKAALEAAFAHGSLSEADVLATGASVDYFQAWVDSHRYGDAYWRGVDLQHTLAKVEVPVHLVAGWYDIFLRDQLSDYAALVASGHAPYLSIGPQHHTEISIQIDALREGLDWFAAYLKGEGERLRRRPVRLYLLGADEWHEMDFWPPPAQMTRYYLQPEHGLSATAPAAASPPSHYLYRPASPTPNFGGALLLSQKAGRQMQNALEARNDVLVYTSPPLEHDLDCVGHVWLELYVRPGSTVSEFVGRLCDVQPDGSSYNVCDGILRVEAGSGEAQPDGSLRIEIELSATAQRFKAGHCIRLHVASAGFPRWSPNAGRGEPVVIDPQRAIEQTILHDRTHPSALLLPVMRPELASSAAGSSI